MAVKTHIWRNFTLGLAASSQFHLAPLPKNFQFLLWYMLDRPKTNPNQLSQWKVPLLVYNRKNCISRLLPFFNAIFILGVYNPKSWILFLLFSFPGVPRKSSYYPRVKFYVLLIVLKLKRSIFNAFLQIFWCNIHSFSFFFMISPFYFILPPKVEYSRCSNFLPLSLSFYVRCWSILVRGQFNLSNNLLYTKFTGVSKVF